jgi:proline iminopeptidase
MLVEANGTRLWFDVEGPSLVPDGDRMRQRPTLVLVHGGPGAYDHSYFKPWFGAVAESMQVVYLDLRDHGRSARGDPAEWSFELCADDVHAFCGALGIERPVVLGHSMGGFVAVLYAARHPGHAAGLVLLASMARFDLDRLTEGFRSVAGDAVAALARGDYSGERATTAEQWAAVFAAFGPHVPSPEQLTRRTKNLAVAAPGMALLRTLDIRDALGAVDCPTLICTGELDPVAPPEAAREIAARMPPGVARLEVLPGAGHFPWLDVHTRLAPLITAFAEACRSAEPPSSQEVSPWPPSGSRR